MIVKIRNYIKESFDELKKVKWLSQKETLNYTIEIILFSFFFLIIYGIFDNILVRLVFIFK